MRFVLISWLNIKKSIITISSVCVMLFSSLLLQAQVSTDELKSTLIVQFCENVNWPETIQGEIVIGCYTDNDHVYKILESVRNRVRIKGLPFSVKMLDPGNEIHGCHAIYYQKSDKKDLVPLFTECRENKILLITDNYPDQLFVMINIMDEKGKLNFKVNMPNLTLAGFTVQTNLLLNGGSVVDIKAAYQKFENQLDESRNKLESSQKALEKNENLLREKDRIIKQKEQEINQFLFEIANYKEISRRLELQVENEKKMLEEKSGEIIKKDRELAGIYSDIRQKQDNLAILKKNVEDLNKESDSLRIEVEKTRFVISEKNQYISDQKKLLILFLCFIIALVIAAFAIVRLLLIKKKHNVELEEKVKLRTKEINQRNQQYLSLVNLAPVAIWEMDLSKMKNYLDSITIFTAEHFDQKFKKDPDLILTCLNKIQYIQVNKASLELYAIEGIEKISDLYTYLHANGTLEGLAEELKLLFLNEKINNYPAIRFSANMKRLDVLVNWLDISPKTGTFSRVLLTMVDVTHLRQIEKELIKHQEHLESLVKERTEEIAVLNEELAEQNNMLHDSNKMLAKVNSELQVANNELLDQKMSLNKALEDLKQVQMQMVQSEKMASLGVLTAGVAHEINNPLNFIMGGFTGLTSFFEENRLMNDEKIALLLNSVKTGIDRTADIVKSLNQFSRNKETFDENCDIHAILENCLVILRNCLKNKIDVNKEYCDTDIIITGNIGKLHQVFLNILNNSVQAIHESGKITISTKKEIKYIRIEIRDNGCGIDKKILPKVLDPFFTTKEPGKGTGLGLSITYNIVKEHHGILEIESEPGTGTKVIIKFPVTQN